MAVETVSRPTISPPLKWHGGKHYLSDKIHALADQTTYKHRVITHGGGMAELWNWEHDGISEIANDINGNLSNFWNVLRDEGQFADFQRRVQATPFSRPLWDEAEKHVTSDTGRSIERAFWFFVYARQSMAGRMDSFTPISRTRTRRGMNEQCSAWLSAIDGLPRVHERLKRVLILNTDAIKIIQQQDGPDTLFYSDPPYLRTTRTAPDVYQYEMTLEQHEQLLTTLASIKGKFILSAYQNDLYQSYADRHGWSKDTHELPNNAATGAKKKRMTEVLFYNFEI